MNANVHFIETEMHNKQHWESIIHSKNKGLFTNGTSWPKTSIQVAYRSNLFNDQHELKRLLDNFTIKNDELVKMLAMIKSGQSPDLVSKQWVSSHNDIILTWLTGL